MNALMPATSFRLFAYGTLQQPEVQLASFGRLLDGQPDVLKGYALRPLDITDPHVVTLSGAAVHTIACRTDDPSAAVEGVVYNLSASELEAADRYEVDAYARAEVRLASGLQAFAYVGPPFD